MNDSKISLFESINTAHFNIMNARHNTNGKITVYVSSLLYKEFKFALLLTLYKEFNIFVIIDDNRSDIDYGFTYKKDIINEVNRFFEKS
jgi:hypothetical protein